MAHLILHEVGTYLLEKRKLFWLYAVPHNKHGIDLLKWKANDVFDAFPYTRKKKNHSHLPKSYSTTPQSAFFI